MFHQINSNVHNNSINNSNHHNNNLFEEEYSHTQCTPRALWNIVECLCLYVCMFVCEFALLFGRIYSSKSLFFWSAPRLRDFSKKKSEWEPRENNYATQERQRESLLCQSTPRFFFIPAISCHFTMTIWTNTKQREKREKRGCEQVFPNALVVVVVLLLLLLLLLHPLSLSVVHISSFSFQFPTRLLSLSILHFTFDLKSRRVRSRLSPLRYETTNGFFFEKSSRSRAQKIESVVRRLAVRRSSRSVRRLPSFSFSFSSSSSK